VPGCGATRAEPFAQMRRAGLRYDDVGHFFTGRVYAHAIEFAAIQKHLAKAEIVGRGRNESGILTSKRYDQVDV